MDQNGSKIFKYMFSQSLTIQIRKYLQVLMLAESCVINRENVVLMHTSFTYIPMGHLKFEGFASEDIK